MAIFEFGKYWDTATFFLYFVLGIMVCLLCKQGAKQNAKRGHADKWNGWYVIAFWLLVPLYTFRDISVGRDTEIYVDRFLNISVSNLDLNIRRFISLKQVEPLYQFYDLAIHQITNNYTVYFFCYSLLISFGFICFIKSFWNAESSYIFLCLFVILYKYDMSSMKSALAISFLLMSFVALKNNKIIRAFLYTIISGMFHYTTLINICYIIYVVILRKRRTNFNLKFMTLSALGVSAIQAAYSFVIPFLLQSKYRMYLENRNSLIGNWYIILTVAVVILLCYYREERKNESFYMAGIASSFSMFLMMLSVLMGAYRLLMYYSMLRLVVWDTALAKLISWRNNKYLCKLVALGMVVFYLLFALSRDSSVEGFPYLLRK